jgi:hypothetical protein
VTVTVERLHVSKPEPTQPPAIARPAYLKRFAGSYFSLEYAGSWNVDAADLDKGSYLDTTLRSSANPNVLVRVDVSPGVAMADPAVSARKLERILRQQPGYRRLDFRRINFKGQPAFRWEFQVAEGGPLLRKVDIFFNDQAGHGYGVLTQAPAATYALWRRFFQQTRNSLKFHETLTTSASGATATSPSTEAVSPPQPEPPAPVPRSADFCATHTCIQNFDNGVGTIIECADGMWSHSGGRPGACSYHGGVAGGRYNGSSIYAPDYSSGDGYTEDYGNGNGYTVTCADGTLSDSGGIQGACSHHRGVG